MLELKCPTKKLKEKLQGEKDPTHSVLQQESRQVFLKKTYQVEKLIKKLIFVVIAYFNITIFKNGYKTTVFLQEMLKNNKKV